MRVSSSFVSLGLAAAIILSASSASATPSVNISATPVQRLNPDGTAAASHAMPVGTIGVNYSDCVGDMRLGFTVNVTAPDSANYSLQVWAGTNGDCSLAASRTASTAVCWKVHDDLGQLGTQVVQIYARDIAAQLGLMGTSLDLQYNGPAAATSCEGKGSGEFSPSIYFVLVPSGGADGVGVSKAIKMKLGGPAAPTINSVGAGDGLLKISWTPATDTATQGFAVFVDPPVSGANPYADGGIPVTTCNTTTVDGGVDDAGNPITTTQDAGCMTTYQTVPEAGTCGSSILGSGATAAQLAPYEATTLSGSTNATATITGLTNGQTYNVAVAATDNYDNVGPVSAVSSTTCGVPAPVDDFWKKCQESGCAPGSCAVDMPGAKTGAIFSASVLALLGTLLVKRRRR